MYKCRRKSPGPGDIPYHIINSIATVIAEPVQKRRPRRYKLLSSLILPKFSDKLCMNKIFSQRYDNMI